MSVFDRQRPLKTLKRFVKKFFKGKNVEKIDFVDTTKPVMVEYSDATGSPTPGDGGMPGGTDVIEGGSINEGRFTKIQDFDGDTKVDTEETADEDKIRFDTGGRERFRMDANDTNGGALYIKEGSGTTAPSTPASGEGVFYEKNDGKIYFKNDAGTEYDLTSGGGGSGAPTDAQYVTLATDGDLSAERVLTAGTGISLTDAGANSTITVAATNNGTMSSFTLTGDSGSNQTVADGNTVDIEGGTGISTVVGATDKVTVNCDLEGTEVKSTGETGGTKFLREDGDGTCSWQTASGGGAPDDAQYVTLATDGDLDNERVLTAGDRITLTDGGAGSTATIAAAQQRVIISHTWAIGGEVKVASGDTDFIIPMTVRDRYTSSGYNTTVKIVSVIASINSGTNVTWKLTKNGSDLTGYGTSASPLTATATPATTESTQALADKDELAPVVVAISSTPKNMSITAFLEITAA
jgi:hypothetical protein